MKKNTQASGEKKGFINTLDVREATPEEMEDIKEAIRERICAIMGVEYISNTYKTKW